jgi:para-nitrobenzyl esterase
MLAVTSSGPVRGREIVGGAGGRTVNHFGAVPYASATRFGLPEPPEPWTEPRDATRPGAAPPQRTAGLDIVPGMAPDATAEQCLTAEVWTIGLDGNRPVLVWIPGGSFRVGGAGLATYDGRHLAADGDVVVVGLNYRLGLLGFLDTPGVPSNLGLRDLLTALDWVQGNIAGFGGDPTRVTLIGESAGAGAIIHLLTRPTLPCAGAIIVSGAPAMTQTESVSAGVGARVLELAGAPTAADLVDRSVEEILDLQDKAVADLARSVGMMPFHPWVDGDVVPMAPIAATAAGCLAALPLVIVTAAHEMELFRGMVPTLPAEYALAMLRRIGAPLGLTAEGVASGLEACGGDLVPAIADVDLHLPSLAIARSHAQRGLAVWRATITWRSAAHQACHAVDLPFHFGTFEVPGWREFVGAVDPAEAVAADRLSARMRQAWATFATTGKPACEPIGEWPQFDGGDALIELGRRVAVVADPAGERLRSWQ